MVSRTASLYTLIVIGLLNVLAPIQLDDDGSFEIREVAYVRANRMLTSKLEASELTSTQVPPKQAFFIGRVLAKGACAAKHVVILIQHKAQKYDELHSMHVSAS
jgi:hypothetical protein